MKVLQIHNEYNHFGGEDVIVALENKLLKKNKDVEVSQLIFNNNRLDIRNLIFNKTSYKKLKNEILKQKPDIIHVHNIFYKATPSVLKCAKDFDLPVVMTLHNFRLICLNGLLLRDQKPCLKCVKKTFQLDAVKYNCFQDSKAKTLALSINLGYHNKKNTWDGYVDKFIVLSQFAKNMFLNSSLKINSNKIIIKPNSVDDFNFETSNNDREDYVFIGRLSNEKGPQIAVEAFNNLPFKLHVIGTGPLEQGLKIKASGNIIFHGLKSREFIVNTLKKSKALIFPSICFEGLPNTILEAYSTATPIISSDIDNIKDIVKNNITGLHFKTNSAIDLRKKINQFDKLENNMFNIKSREEYLEKYSHEKNNLSLLKIYQEAIISNEKNKHS
ncbi:glycosyltransferase family 4 protein [Leptobacterium sp. I13]|uniref:glycosyltransferase family 4 protein n=1 Tax=Leptobacterium meishanense TaxID=3128904 RepID=UPI0030EE7B6F